MSDASTHSLSTGYGPSRLIFDGNEEKYELWEIKFLAHLRLQKLADVLKDDDSSDSDDEEFTEKNARVFAELVQRLDDKSLALIIREAKDDGKKALKILRSHYLGSSKPRIISLYTQLTSLQKGSEESVTNYVIRIEKTEAALTQAGETLSDGLLVAMALKGLPASYSAFSTVITQKDSDVTFSDFKSALKAYEETEKSRRNDAKIFNLSDKSIKCYNCGALGHKTFQCRNYSEGSNSHYNRNKWCHYCRSNTHETKNCRKKTKSTVKTATSRSDVADGGAPGYVDETPARGGDGSDGNTNYIMKTQCHVHGALNSGKTDNNTLLIDTGATSHIISDPMKFVDCDVDFNPSNHYIELADGSRCNNIVKCKGDATVLMTDSKGTKHNVTLKNALCIPSFKQDIFSVQAATEQGVSVNFHPDSADLTTGNGTVFNIEKKGKLYFINKVLANQATERSLEEWHFTLGHCNKEDVLKLSNVVKGMTVSRKDIFSCDTCIKGKFTQFRNRSADPKAKNVLDLVHCDIMGPVDPMARDGFRYAINFVDDKSGYYFAYVIKNKSDASIALKQFLADSAPYGAVKCLRSDNALEFTCNYFESILRENRIKHEFSAPYSSHQNGTAERAWRSLLDMTRCLLIESQLPKTLWGYAFKTAAYIRNRCYNNRTGLTPYEVMTSKTPDLSHMHTFGKTCFAYIQGTKKLDDKAKQGIFIGYDHYSPAYFVYFQSTGKISKVRMVSFPRNKIIENFEQEDDIVYNYPDNSAEEVHAQNQNNSEDQDRRYPQRIRSKPKYLEDYVQYSVDYCYRATDMPSTYEEAINSHEALAWKTAMDTEIEALKDNDTYELTELPDGKTPIKCRWVYTVKSGPNDEESHKARLVAKGYTQVQGIDYHETFSPTARIASIRSLLHIAAHNNYKISQMDVKSAYLNANIDTELYLEQPKGYEYTYGNGNNLVWRLKKSLYGLKQSGRMWNECFHSFLSANSFVQSLSDSCVYTKLEGKSIIILILFVDDVLIASNDDIALTKFKSSLSNKFKMKDIGDLSWFLGIKFDISCNEIKMSQSKSINKLVERFGMTDCHSKPVPCDLNQKNFDDMHSKPANKTLYQEIIGSLIYIMSCTRPDICFIVSKLSQYMHNPTVAHLNLAKNVIRYLKGTSDYCLTFSKSDKLELFGYCDSDWANDSIDRKSITGFCFKLCKNGPVISWRTKKQNVVALSSCEAEYVAITEAVKEAKFLLTLIQDMTVKLHLPVKLNVDNQGAIALAKNPVHHQRTKHIDVRYHFIRSEIQNNVINLEYISTQENLSDVFTKPVSKQRIAHFVPELGLMS